MKVYIANRPFVKQGVLVTVHVYTQIYILRNDELISIDRSISSIDVFFSNILSLPNNSVLILSKNEEIIFFPISKISTIEFIHPSPPKHFFIIHNWNLFGTMLYSVFFPHVDSLHLPKKNMYIDVKSYSLIVL